MRKRIFLRLLIIWMIVSLGIISLNAADNQNGSYMEFKRFPLTSKLNGMDGSLVLMRDYRAMNISNASEETETFHNAQLCIIDKNGKSVETIGLEKSIANLEAKQLIAGKPISYILTVDRSIGMGSYAGPESKFLDITNGKIKWIRAIDKKSSELKTIQVATTLKIVWKFVNARANFDILQLLCRPSLKDKKEFNLIYERYHYDGEKWIKYSTVKKEYWEDDNPFPKENLFPAIP